MAEGAFMVGECMGQRGVYGTEGGVNGRGHAWWGACMAGGQVLQEAYMSGGHTWQRGIHGRGGVCGGGHAWLGSNAFRRDGH